LDMCILISKIYSLLKIISILYKHIILSSVFTNIVLEKYN
jgi:hypothetical protein